MDQVTLQPTQLEQEDQVTLRVPGATVIPVTGETAATRAKKYDLAMGVNSPGADQIQNTILTGSEPNLRQTAALNEEARRRQEQTKDFLSRVNQGQIETNQAYQVYLDYTQPVKVDPSTVMEETFGMNYLKTLYGINASIDQIRRRAMEENPVETMAALEGTQKLLARQQIAQNVLDDFQARAGDYNYLSQGLHHLGTFLPAVSATNISQDKSVSSVVFSGDNLEQARDKYWSFKSLEEARRWLVSEAERIAKFNPQDAVNFLKAMVDYNQEDKWVNNVIGVSDVTPIGTIAAGAKAVAASQALRRVLAHGVKGAADGLRMENIAAATGDLDKAADILRAKNVIDRGDAVGLADSIRELPWDRNIVTMIERNPGTLGADRARKLTMTLQDTWSKLLNAALKPSRVQRLPEEAHEAMLANAKNRIIDEFPSANDYVVNNRLLYEKWNNSYYGELWLANRDGTLPQSIKAIERLAFDELGLDINQFKIKNDPNFIGINPEGMAAARALDPIKQANKVQGFTSIKGQVRLKDGTEITVSNRKDGIYQTGTKQIDPSDITHYKNSAKGSDWTKVPSETKKRVSEIFKGAQIKQLGTGYYISITRAVDETDPAVRAVILTQENTNPTSFANWALGGWVRSAEDQLAYFQRGNRHIATHAPNAILQEIGEISKPIGTLSKQSFDDLNVILTRNRDYVETVDGELVRGRAYNSQAALEKEWLDAHKRVPTDQESLAYWTYHELMDLDWVLRNTGVHRDLARLGVSERMTVTLGEDAGKVSFPGKFVRELPNTKEPIGLLIIEDGVPVVHKRLDTAEGPGLRKKVEELTENGYKIYMVANPTDRPFKKHLGSGAKVNFVVSKNTTSEPLPMNLVDRNPGVHVQYPHEWFSKQPIVETIEGGLRVLFGDRTIFGADTEAKAIKQAKNMDDLRIMFRDQKPRAEIEDHIARNLPRDYDFWYKKFYGGDGEEAYLSLEHPILHTHSGKEAFAMPQHRHYLERPEYKDMHNERNSEFNLMRAVDMDFMADRNAPLMQIINKGSDSKPIWDLEKARVLDPMVSINRALSNSVRTTYLNDIKASAIEQWAKQYGKYLTRPIQAENNPFQAFYHGELIKGSDFELASAHHTRARILNFIGTQTELGRDLDWFQAKVMNGIQRLEDKEFLGQELLAKGSVRYYNDHELRLLKDPVSFFRSMMYHVKFGFFNIKQFLVQSQGFTHATGIMMGAHGPVEGGKMASQAMAAYLFQRGIDFNNFVGNINFAANKAKAWGWKKEHYLEASNWMKDDGWKIIGHEQSMDDVFDPKLWRTTGGRILDWGTSFFREGERLVRMTSGFMAYLEWRKANPFAEFNDFAKAKVLTRADDLSANMTRASHSALQEGVFRPATQFYTFNQRIMEQFWSGGFTNKGRLTWKEKAGAFSAHAMLYGVPASVAAFTLVPWHDVIRQEALTKGEWMGIPLDINNKWYEAATEGFMAYMIHQATGKQYDVAGRYSPAISDAVLKIFEGERNPFEIASGATGTFIQDVWGATVGPVYRAVYSGMFGKGNEYTITTDDIMPLLNQVATVNEGKNAWLAWNTMKYYSKNGRLVADDMSQLDAAMIMAGLTRRDIKDANLILGKLQHQAEVQRDMSRRAEREFRLAFQYMADGEYTKADVHMANAKVYMVVFGDLRDQQMHQTLHRVMEENQPLVKVATKRLLETGYKSQIPQRLRRILGLQ